MTNKTQLAHMLRSQLEDLELEYQREPSAELKQQIDDLLARLEELK
jgi:hypothetical protein